MSEITLNESVGDEKAVERLRCSCSVMGFEDPLWVSTYYPPECPEDWRVAYFCNDFSSMYLPVGDWVGNESVLDTLLEEIEPGFDLVLEWPVGMDLSGQRGLLAQLEPLKSYIACVVLDPGDTAPADLHEQLQLLSSVFAVNFEPSERQDVIRLMQDFALGCVWYPGQEDFPVSGCAYQVVKMPSASLREITPILKQLDQFLTGDQRAGVFLQAAPNSAQRALEARTVIELMGM